MKPKILLVANTDWYLYNFRLSLAQSLRQQDYRVVLVSPPGRFTENFTAQGFPWRSWEVGRKSLSPWTEARSLLALAGIYRQEQPDLIHHHTIKPVLYGSLVARVLGMQNVVNSITGRGYVFTSNDCKARWLKRLALPFYRLAFRHPNYATIFENEEDQRYFHRMKLAMPDRSWLINGVGVDPERFTPCPEQPGKPVILYSGRMLWDKGVGVLVEAARLLKNARVVLVGEPDPGNPGSVDRQQLQSWHAAGLVEWWGWQSDMNQVYARSHIFAMPTMYGEGVPTVLLEAAACGKPIVATDIPGCREIVSPGLNGFLVPLDDPLALAKALQSLVDDVDLRGRMGLAGRSLILQKFTTLQVNARTVEVYRHVLHQPAPV